MKIDPTIIQIIDQIENPAFLAKDETIVYANTQAVNFQFCIGSNILELTDMPSFVYLNDWTEPRELPIKSGAMYFNAKMSRAGEFVLFILSHITAKSELTALHLAAVKLKRPLFDLMNSVNEAYDRQQDIDPVHKKAMLKHLHQLHRIVSNMDCACKYRFKPHHPEATEMRSYLQELFEKISDKLKLCNVSLEYNVLSEVAFCSLDRTMFTNAIMNMITNALDAKATVIHAEISNMNDAIRISITDNGDPIIQGLRINMFNTFLREPTIEDGHLGLGLGMVIIHAAAIAHNGTLLMDCCNADETRITMTLPLSTPDSTLRQKAKTLFVDRTGGMDPVMVHLSGYLSPDQFDF